jgi:glutamate synthase (NADPH) large chain
VLFSALPHAQGLYDPERESDSCGVAMIIDIPGRRSHAIVADGLVALEHLDHRGAAGAETNSGDGAGILIQLPTELFRDVVEFDLPGPTADGCNAFAAGICFLPADHAQRTAACAQIEAIADEDGLHILGWRELPVDPAGADVGATARSCMPHMAQTPIPTASGCMRGCSTW